MDRIDLEKYHQNGGTYTIPTEIMNLFLDEIDTLNKGIDELIKKYEEMSVHDYTFIKYILQDLNEFNRKRTKLWQ